MENKIGNNLDITYKEDACAHAEAPMKWQKNLEDVKKDACAHAEAPGSADETTRSFMEEDACAHAEAPGILSAPQSEIMQTKALQTKALHRKLRSKAGLTLVEVLIAVAILAVVSVVGVIAFASINKSLKQKELDSKAEIIFTAAQTRLTDLYTSGRQSLYYSGDGQLKYVPQDADADTNLTADSLYFVTSDKKDVAYAPASEILPEEYVEAELRDHDWVIEYDRDSAIVYGVFYTEKDEEFTENYAANPKAYDTYRDKDVRRKNGCTIGYYGGNEAQKVKASTEKLSPSLVIENGEKLIAKLSCASPDGSQLKFTVTLTDSKGNTCTEEVAATKTGSNYYTAEYIMDDLSSSSSRFANKYSMYGLVPGSDITVTLTVSPVSASSGLDSASKTTVTNSLFASIESSGSTENTVNNANVLSDTAANSLLAAADSGGSADGTANNVLALSDEEEVVQDTAIVTCGRHLMNLGKSSGVTDDIEYGIQRSDIEFSEVNGVDDNWYAYYGSKGITFTPITNQKLKTFTVDQNISTSEYYTIHGMQVDVSKSKDDDGNAVGENAGMFGIFYGTVISDVTLIGSDVNGGQTYYAGVLAGTIAANTEGVQTEITNCHAYLDYKKDIEGNNITIGETSFVKNGATGGLIGGVFTSVAISQSSASTIVGSASSANSGGLVGVVSNENGVLSISESYADCYVYGQSSAGLVGGGPVVSVSESYAVGYLWAQKQSAGLVNGNVSSMTSTYTACNLLEGSATTRYSTVVSFDAGATVSNVYYCLKGTKNQDSTVMKTYKEMNDKKAFITALGSDKFTDDTGVDVTEAYNFMNQGLKDYSYPRLSMYKHYGDWSANFESGSLVYYEHYNDGSAKGSYGFYGGNINLLKDDSVIDGDGYGVVFETVPDVAFTVQYQTGVDASGNPVMSDTVSIPVTDYKQVTHGTATYYLVTLPKSISDVAFGSSNFYHKITINKGESTETYYYNPHLPFTQTKTDTMPKTAPAIISVRTPRHLYDMSLYYEYYYSKVATSTFLQEMDLDYTQYAWTTYANVTSAVTSQGPIGYSKSVPFASDYNGQCHIITNVSYISKIKDRGNVGLIGYNEGTLSNIFAVCEYYNDSDKDYILRYENQTEWTDVTANIGTIAGVNEGAIRNCAAAGYSSGKYGVNVYDSSTARVGGLVGYNYNGRIENCSSDCPGFTATAGNTSTLYMGGFCGHNTGVIKNSYSLTSIKVTKAENCSAIIAGFVGYNKGIIQSSYCTADLLTSGVAVSYGFTTEGGMVKDDCRYLNNGFYSYVGVTNSYVYADYSAGSSVNLSADNDGLINYGAEAFGQADAANSRLHTKTAKSENEAYPYRAVVKDASGKYIHFGNWVNTADLGIMGVFYWEHETGGSNDGYRVRFLFTDGGSHKSISTLCEMHDDGGSVSEYGYGWYKIISEGISVDFSADSTITIGSAEQTDVTKELEKMVDGYEFHPYKTGYGTGSSSSFMYMNSETRNSQWTLTYTSGDNTVYDRYIMNPFFGNALTVAPESGTTGSYGPGSVADTTSDYVKCPYEIRSVEQLQYINWNYETCSVSTPVEETVTNGGGYYKNYPYLQYATALGTNTMTPASVDAARPVQYYKQTHDLNPSENTGDFNPIAGTNVTTKAYGTDAEQESYDVNMLAWFGGQYDGQSYVIKNIHIVSDYSNVGIFGTTLGAVFNNVIVYGDNDALAVVERRTEASDNTGSGAYVIGGLFGYAYDYNKDSNRAVINNCAMSGYRIIDNTTKKQGRGEANVGGMIGVSRIPLTGCTSVVDIEINCTHKDPDRSGYITIAYAVGNYIRVGGIAGADQYSMTDCYSGGSITVGDEVLKETANSSNKILTSASSGTAEKYHSTHIFIGGLCGSGFCSNFYNITGEADTGGFDGSPTFKNCYTYMDFPALEGTIRAISIFGSMADRYANVTKAEQYNNLTEENCYYLESCADIDTSNICDIKFKYSQKSMFESDPTLLEEMLSGQVSYLDKLFSNADRRYNVFGDALTPVSYDQLSGKTAITSKGSILDALNKNGSAYALVSTTETIGGITAYIHGKYSFGGSSSALKGKDYPFPTIVTQQNELLDGDDKTVHVHYGRWPTGSVFFVNSQITFDIFEHYSSADKESVYGLKEGEDEILVKISGEKLIQELVSGSKKLSTRFIDDEGEEVSQSDSCISVKSMEQIYDSATGSLYYKFTVRAKESGSVYLEAYAGDSSTNDRGSVHITVTAKANLSADPYTITKYEGEQTTVNLYLKDDDGEDFTFGDGTYLSEDTLSWEAESNDEKIATVEDEVTQVEGEHYYQSVITNENADETGTTVNYKANISLDLGDLGTKEFTYETQVSVVTKPQSYIGAGFTGGNPYRYNQGAVPNEGETPGTVTGKDKTFESGSEPYLATATSFVYFYGDKIDASKLTKDDIRVTGLTYSDGTEYDGQYICTIGSYVKGSEYGYFPIYITGASATDLTLNMAVEVDYTYDETETTYKLSSKCILRSVEHFKILLLDNEGNALMEDEYGVLPGNTAQLSDVTAGITAEPANPSRQGYHNPEKEGAEGYLQNESLWNTQADGTGKAFDSEAVVTEDMIYYLQPQANGYTVRFDGNGTEVTGTMEDMTFTYGEAAKALTLNAFEYGENEFAGWNTRADGSGVSYTDGQEVQNMTTDNGKTVYLYAQWKLIVNYDKNSEEASGTISSQYKEKGKTLTLSDNKDSGGTDIITREGYILQCWNTVATPTEENPGTRYDLGGYYEADASATLYAQWEKKTYKITYEANYEAEPKVEAVVDSKKHGDAYTIRDASAFTRDGYAITGWNTVANPTTSEPGESYAFGESYPKEGKKDGSITLYAQWSKCKTITYHANDGSAEPATTKQTINKSSTSATGILGNDTFTRDGMVMTSWNTKEDGTGTDYAFDVTFTYEGEVPKDLYAQWAYEVSYDANGAEGTIDTQTKKPGGETTKLTLSDGAAFTRTGYHITGWNTKADGTGDAYAVSGVYSADASATMYAQWELNTYTIKYDANGGTGTISDQTKTHGTPVTLSDGTAQKKGETTFTKQGFVLTGWNTVATPTSEEPGVAYELGGSYPKSGQEDKDITLYAQWTACKTITYNANDGTATPATKSQTVVYGESPVSIFSGNTFLRDGYVIDSWNTSADGTGTKYEFTATFEYTESKTPPEVLYAQWKADTIKVNYYDGTTLKKTVSKAKNASFNVFTADEAEEYGITKTGYHLTGWKDTATKKEYTPGAAYSAAESDINLEAVWQINTYTITFNKNDGTDAPETKTATTTHGAEYTMPGTEIFTNPDREGYKFTGGWKTAAGDEYTPGQKYTTITGDITLYAQWKEITYTVSYSKGEYAASGTAPDSQTKKYNVDLNLADNTKSNLTRASESASYGTVTLHFDANGGTGAPDDITAAVTKTTAYEANGWSTTDGSVSETPEYAFGAAYSTNSDLGPLYPSWKSSESYACDTVTLPETQPAKDGYKFTGWYDGSAENATQITKDNISAFMNQNPTQNKTLTAHWEKIAYYVSFDCDGGSAVASYWVDFDASTKKASVTLPEAATASGQTGKTYREGYTLEYWTAEGSSEQIQPGDSVSIEKDTKFTAHWQIKSYTITYHDNIPGSTADPLKDTYTHSDDSRTLYAATKFTRAGFSIKEWNTEADGTGTSYACSGSVKNVDLELYAIWESKPYTVTYNTNGGSTISQVSVDHGDASSVSYTTANRSSTTKNAASSGSGGSYLYKWKYTDAQGTEHEIDPGSAVTITGDTTFTAVWKKRIVFELSNDITSVTCNNSNITVDDTVTSGGSKWYFLCEESYVPGDKEGILFTLVDGNKKHNFPNWGSHITLTLKEESQPRVSLLVDYWDYEREGGAFSGYYTAKVTMFKILFSNPGEILVTIQNKS